MQNQPQQNSDRAVDKATPESSRTVIHGQAAPLGYVLKKRAPAPSPPVSAVPPTPPPPVPAPRTLGYPFVPYPKELVEMERKHELSPTQVRILLLRRFADPTTGQWITSTKEVARLIDADRSTAHKGLRALQKALCLHLRQIRSRTTQLVVWFGGFMQQDYVDEGLPPLRWDRSGTLPTQGSAQSGALSGTPPHTPGLSDSGSTEPSSGMVGEIGGTATSKSNGRDIRNNEYTNGANLTLVDKFVPQSHDESVVHDLAKKLGEPYMNSFLKLRRTYGLGRLQRACGLALDKAQDTKYPLRERPGAYVAWLLQNGRC